MFDHLVGSPEFASIQADLQKRIEQDMNFEFPCLAQSLIDETEHADLVAKSFRVPLDELERSGLTFDRGRHKKLPRYYIEISAIDSKTFDAKQF